MAYIKFANNVLTHITSDIQAATTSIPVLNATKMPDLDSFEDVFYLTLLSTDNLNIEIVKVVDINKDSSTVEVLRGQEGTVAQDFASGSYISNNLTAEALTLLMSNREVYIRMLDAPSYIDASSFSVVGDRIEEYKQFRHIRLITPTSKATSDIASSTYNGTITTVVLTDAILTGPENAIDLGVSKGMLPTNLATHDQIVALQQEDATLHSRVDALEIKEAKDVSDIRAEHAADVATLRQDMMATAGQGVFPNQSLEPDGYLRTDGTNAFWARVVSQDLYFYDNYGGF